MRWYLVLAVILTFAGHVAATPSGDVVISPDSKGVFVDRFFKDYKSSNNPNPGDSSLDDLFIEDGLNGIRTPIWGNINQPAHPSSGTVIGSYYAGHVSTILRAKQRNPDLMVLASKKLNGQDSFPDWTKDTNGVIAVEYAAMLADYIEYMNSEGIDIDVLGIDNERSYNEGNIIAGRHKDIVDELEALSVSRGFDMPQIIGHEDFGPRPDWMEDLITGGWGDRLDIYGTHYYAQYRPLSKLQTDLAWAGEREKWHTELHWDQKDTDDMVEAEQSICAMWDCTDNGMNGLMWWSYARTGFRGSIMRAFSVPLVNAWQLGCDDPDGTDTTTLGRLQTRAFLKGNQLTVFALNVNSGTDYSNLIFRVDSGKIIGDIDVLQWTSTNDTAGAVSAIAPSGEQHFISDLPDRTITSFSFTFTLGGLLAHYPFEGNADDVSSNAVHGTELSTAYPPGREGFGLNGTIEVPTVSFDDFLATFWLQTDQSDGALIAGDDVSVALVGSKVAFSAGSSSTVSAKPLDDGCWHHIAVERLIAEGELRIYVDGRLEGYGTGADAEINETSFVLGGIDGVLDEVHFCDCPYGADDSLKYNAPSVMLAVGGNAAERGPVESTVFLTSSPGAANYPFVDMVEDDGTWLDGYNKTQLRAMSAGTAAHPVLAPNAGTTFFWSTTDYWWRGVCKPQFENLTVEAGTYSVRFYVGDADTGYLFYSVYTDPVSGNNVGLTATDPAAPVLPNMNATVNSLIHKLDTAIGATFDVSVVPGDGEWVQWSIDYTVPSSSPLIGRQLGFLFRKPYRNGTYETKSTGAFDGPLMIEFVPASAETLPVAVDYNLAGSTATPGDDYNALPPQLTVGSSSVVPVADLIEEGTETIVIALEASTNFYISGTASQTIAIVDHPMDGWRADLFGADATNPAVAGDAANPDGDALNNDLEWALVTDPVVADAPAMNPAVSGETFNVSFERRKDSGFTVGTSWSWSLTDADWRTDGLEEGVVGESGDVETITASVPLDGTNKFIRISVE